MLYLKVVRVLAGTSPGRAFQSDQPPVDSYTGKRFYLCGTVGKRNLGSHFEKQPKEARAFDYLKRGSSLLSKGIRETKRFRYY